ncbi:unnamed protein product [Chrysoparadoxa australica]
MRSGAYAAALHSLLLGTLGPSAPPLFACLRLRGGEQESEGLSGGETFTCEHIEATGVEQDTAFSAGGDAATVMLRHQGVVLVEEECLTPGSKQGKVAYAITSDGCLQVGSLDHKEGVEDRVRAARMLVHLLNTMFKHPKMIAKIGSNDAARELCHLVAEDAASLVKQCRAGLLSGGTTLRALFKRTLLPIGFPHTVPPEYLRFLVWYTMQDMSTSIRGFLATQAVFEGMGVGKAGSSSLAATSNWMIRKGAGKIGGLVFTGLFSKSLGANIKGWRLLADVALDLSLTLEMFAACFPKRLLSLICVASVLKAISGVAGGATDAAIVEHFSIHNNIADVTAKGSAQHTVSSLVGMGIAFGFLKVINVSPVVKWATFILLTVEHVLCNLECMRTLALRSLNPARLRVLASNYVDRLGHLPSSRGQLQAGLVGLPALSLQSTARREDLVTIPWRGWLRRARLLPWGDSLEINLGVRCKSLVEDVDDLLWITDLYRSESIMVGVDVDYRPLGPKFNTVILAALRRDAGREEQVFVYLLAHLVRRHLLQQSDEIPQGDAVLRKLYLRHVMEVNLRRAKSEWKEFRKALVAEGWDLQRVSLSPLPHRGSWGGVLKPRESEDQQYDQYDHARSGV